MSCIFRVSSVSFDVDSFLKQSHLEPDRLWHKGEKAVSNRVCENSGFTMVASDAEMNNLGQQIEDAITFLKENQAGLEQLKNFPNVDTPYLDFAIEDRNVAGQYDRFPPELLRLAGNLNIGIEISRYATSEDS